MFTQEKKEKKEKKEFGDPNIHFTLKFGQGQLSGRLDCIQAHWVK